VVTAIAARTDLEVELLDGASRKTRQVGHAGRARVTKAVVLDGMVTEAILLKKIGGVVSLGLRFDTLELPAGTPLALHLEHPLMITVQP